MGFQSLDMFLDNIMPRWTLHDLQRTYSTMMNDFGLAEPHIIEAVLNHVSGDDKRGVAGVYNHAAYLVQRRRAMDRLGDFLMAAIGEYERGGFPAVQKFAKSEKQTRSH